MGKSRTPFQSASFSPHLIRRLIWELGLDALKRAEKDPQLRKRIKVAIMRYLFSAALGGGRALGRMGMVGFPEPRIELPDLRRSPQLDLSGVQLYLDYKIAYQRAKRLWPRRRGRIAQWAQDLLKELPDLTQRDIPECQNPSVTAFISVGRKHRRAPETAMRLVRRLPKRWAHLVRDAARAWDGQPATLRALSDALEEVNARRAIKALKKASKMQARTRPPRI